MIDISGTTIHLFPAARLTLIELTEAYNQARSDYIVPMQITAAGLADYMKIYDVDLDHSWVVLDGTRVLGLGMLGVRTGRTWLTRLGVLPGDRRRGAGEVLVRALQESTRALGTPQAFLEVIQGNQAAYALFSRMGFQERRRLVVMRRPPGQTGIEPPGHASWLDGEEALALLGELPFRLPWTNEPETYQNGGDAHALLVCLEDGSQSQLVFRKQEKQLSHFVLNTKNGDPSIGCAAAMAHLFGRYPELESYIENIPVNDVHLNGLVQVGFVEAFRRIEMICNVSSSPG